MVARIAREDFNLDATLTLALLVWACADMCADVCMDIDVSMDMI